MKLALLLFALFLCLRGNSQESQPKSSSELYLQLQKLKNTASVLYVGTRPDDVNLQLLSYLSNEKWLRTGYLSLTRGESSKNYVADETGIDLGLIHAKEAVASGNISGVENFFTRAYDFGSVPTAKDAFAIWPKEKLKTDVVNVIRQFQPDIIIMRYDTTAPGGENAAMAQLVREAFTMAADTVYMPGILNQRWQTKRLLCNVPSDSKDTAMAFRLPVKEYNSLLGSSYYETAVAGRSFQKTEGTDYIYAKENPVERLQLLSGSAFSKDILEGIDTGWEKLGYIEPLQGIIDSLTQDYNFFHPELSVDKLVRLSALIENLPGDKFHWKYYALKNVRNLILDCAGVTVKAVANQEFAVQGDTCQVHFVVENRKKNNLVLTGIRLNSFDTTLQSKDADLMQRLAVSSVEEVTQPYWLSGPVDEDYTYRIGDFLQAGNPENNPRYIAQFSFDINGKKLLVKSPVQYQYISRLQGIRTNNVSVISPVIVSMKPGVLLTHVSTISGKAIMADSLLKVQFKSNFTGDSIAVTVNIAQPEYKLLLKDTVIGNHGATKLYSFDTLMNVRAGDVYNIEIPVTSLALDKSGVTKGVIDASVQIKKDSEIRNYSSNLRYIDYGYIAPVTYNYTNHTAVIGSKIRTSNNVTIGYLNNSYDAFCEGLKKLGYNIRLLSAKEIVSSPLDKLDIVIIKSNSEKDSLYAGTLYKYVQQGGSLLVQLSQADSLSTPVSNRKLYSARLGAGNSFLKMSTGSRIFSYPNTISQNDFADWRKEYSNSEMELTDRRFQDLLSAISNQNQPGGSILADLPYGKGHIVYTGLPFGFEMASGVETAFKQMANLVEYVQ